jgi:hypothetical protein
MRTIVLLENSSHKVKNIQLSSTEFINNHDMATAPIILRSDLEVLPMSNGLTTSFFETRPQGKIMSKTAIKNGRNSS